MDDDTDLPDATPDRDYDTLAELPAGMAPSDRPKVPTVMPPPGSCDCHVHMLGGASDYALAENRVENPAPGRGFEGWLELFRTHLDTLGLGRGVLVQSRLYGSDNAVTLDALERLGPEFRGIALVSEDAGEDAVERLARARVTGVRLNLVRGDAPSWQGAQRLAPFLAARGMHLQIFLRAEVDLAELADDIRALPVPVVIDHMGLPDMAGGTEAAGFQTLLRLVGDGTAHVKLSAPYRVAEEPWDAADPFIEALVAANPERCLWGSDWPHLMLGGNPMPDAGQLLDAFFRTVSGSEARQRILVDTPAALYGF